MEPRTMHDVGYFIYQLKIRVPYANSESAEQRYAFEKMHESVMKVIFEFMSNEFDLVDSEENRDAMWSPAMLSVQNVIMNHDVNDQHQLYQEQYYGWFVCNELARHFGFISEDQELADAA